MKIYEHREALKNALAHIAPAHITAPNTINTDCFIINESAPFITSEEITYGTNELYINFEVLAVVLPRGEKTSEITQLDDLVEQAAAAIHEHAHISDFNVSQYHRVDVAGQAYPVATINFRTEL